MSVPQIKEGKRKRVALLRSKMVDKAPLDVQLKLEAVARKHKLPIFYEAVDISNYNVVVGVGFTEEGQSNIAGDLNDVIVTHVSLDDMGKLSDIIKTHQ